MRKSLPPASAHWMLPGQINKPLVYIHSRETPCIFFYNCFLILFSLGPWSWIPKCLGTGLQGICCQLTQVGLIFLILIPFNSTLAFRMRISCCSCLFDISQPIYQPVPLDNVPHHDGLAVEHRISNDNSGEKGVTGAHIGCHYAKLSDEFCGYIQVVCLENHRM